MGKTLQELKSIFWNMAQMCLSDIITEYPEKWIRKMYPTNGAPDWTVKDNIVFLNLSPRDDDWSRQRDTIYKAGTGTTLKRSLRTRVWDLEVNAYGPRSYEMATAMKDGVFREKIHSYLRKQDIYLVPWMQFPVQSNEIFAGQWWERWNIQLTFNERYDITEDVGYYDKVTIIPKADYL